MSPLLKWGAIAAGAGYLAYRYWPAAVSLSDNSGTLELVKSAAAKAGFSEATADQWNWFYEQARGVPGPDPASIWPNRDRAYRMTAEEWFAGVGSGLSGLGDWTTSGNWWDFSAGSIADQIAAQPVSLPAAPTIKTQLPAEFADIKAIFTGSKTDWGTAALLLGAGFLMVTR